MDYMAKPQPGSNPAAGAHGGGVRGDQVLRGSRMFEGRFGRIFRTLPAAEFDSRALEDLAHAMSAEPERDEKDRTKPAASPETKDRIQDDEENLGIDAGYTYLGQLIDHDITFDPASSLQKQNDPDGLIDFRTPALDLDCVYGRGPDDQPYMYDASGKKFLLGTPLSFTQGGVEKALDLLRLGPNQRAVIGDKRNDENVIVSQLQGVFLRFHNRLVDDRVAELRKQNAGLSDDDLLRKIDFKDVQREMRWHYQYVVVNDFLPKIVGEETMNKIWPNREAGNTCGNGPNLCFYAPREEAFIPIEFSAAAYRFGHSMVRPIYRLNKEHDENTVGKGDHPGLAGRFFIFAGVQERGLNGFGAFPRHWAIDWSLFFDIDGSGKLGGKQRAQPAYKIDTSLVNPLAFLPEFSDPKSFDAVGARLTLDQQPKDNLRPRQLSHSSPSNLAIRNLWRGNSMGLPSGQDVARAMGETPLTPEELLVGKAVLKDDGSIDAKKLSSVRNDYFRDRAPLWYYVLAEALAQWRTAAQGKPKDEANKVPVTLGPVGGRIVAETLIGLLVSDSHSYMNQNPKWKPGPPVASGGTPFTMGHFIKYALKL
jgi:Animal haem peroxidase